MNCILLCALVGWWIKHTHNM